MIWREVDTRTPDNEKAFKLFFCKHPHLLQHIRRYVSHSPYQLACVLSRPLPRLRVLELKWDHVDYFQNPVARCLTRASRLTLSTIAHLQFSITDESASYLLLRLGRFTGLHTLALDVAHRPGPWSYNHLYQLRHSQALVDAVKSPTLEKLYINRLTDVDQVPNITPSNLPNLRSLDINISEAADGIDVLKATSKYLNQRIRLRLRRPSGKSFIQLTCPIRLHYRDAALPTVGDILDSTLAWNEERGDGSDWVDMRGQWCGELDNFVEWLDANSQHPVTVQLRVRDFKLPGLSVAPLSRRQFDVGIPPVYANAVVGRLISGVRNLHTLCLNLQIVNEDFEVENDNMQLGLVASEKWIVRNYPEVLSSMSGNNTWTLTRTNYEEKAEELEKLLPVIKNRGEWFKKAPVLQVISLSMEIEMSDSTNST